jgi:hypothetical protein
VDADTAELTKTDPIINRFLGEFDPEVAPGTSRQQGR